MPFPIRRAALLAGSAALLLAPAVLAQPPTSWPVIHDASAGEVRPVAGRVTVCEWWMEFQPVAGGDRGAWELRADGTRIDDDRYVVTDKLADREPSEGTITLPEGEYTLRWTGGGSAQAAGAASMTVVVACAEGVTAAPTPAGSTAPARSASPSDRPSAGPLAPRAWPYASPPEPFVPPGPLDPTGSFVAPGTPPAGAGASPLAPPASGATSGSASAVPAASGGAQPDASGTQASDGTSATPTGPAPSAATAAEPRETAEPRASEGARATAGARPTAEASATPGPDTKAAATPGATATTGATAERRTPAPSPQGGAAATGTARPTTHAVTPLGTVAGATGGAGASLPPTDTPPPEHEQVAQHALALVLLVIGLVSLGASLSTRLPGRR